MDCEIGYGYGQSNILSIRRPIEEFSNEDNELLKSVLNSSSPQDQYLNYSYNNEHNNSMFINKNMDYFSHSKGILKDVNSPLPPFSIVYQDANINLNNHGVHSNDESSNSSSSFQNVKGKSSPPKQRVDKEIQTFEWKFGSNGKMDIHDSNNGLQKSKRRESQNRASRNYRQRKKAYIKEIEQKLNELQMENEQLKEENEKNQQTLQQIRDLKPAPLLRSFSSELQDNEQEIEKILKKLDILASDPSSSDDEIRVLLRQFHECTSKRESILKEDTLQLIQPEVQEKLVKIDRMTSSKEVEGIDQLLYSIINETTKEQQSKLISLYHEYMNKRSAIWNERIEINQDIKTFYQEKIESERIDSSNLEKTSYDTLGEKLQNLKNNLLRENELNTDTSKEFSKILTPYQEAIITVKHYKIYGENSTATQILHNLWKVMANESNSNFE